MSVRRELYTTVRDRIRAEMPWVRWIDLQKGQMDIPAKTYPLPLPCALVDIKQVTWDSYTDLSQLGQTIIAIWLYLDHSGDSLKDTEMEEQSLELMDRMDDVYQKLGDLSGQSFKRLVRSSDQVVSYKPRMVVFRCDFSTTLIDSIDQRRVLLPQIEITAQFP